MDGLLSIEDVLPGQACGDSTFDALLFIRRAKRLNDSACVAFSLEETRNQLGRVVPDEIGFVLQRDEQAGEYILVAGPPAAFLGILSELDQSFSLRAPYAIQVNDSVNGQAVHARASCVRQAEELGDVPVHTYGDLFL